MDKYEKKDDFRFSSKETPLLPKDNLISDPIRFNILYLLYNFENIGFTPLQKILNITSGNLNHHFKKLINAGFVEEYVKFSPRPLKILKITAKGRKTFLDHIDNLKKLIDPL